MKEIENRFEHLNLINKKKNNIRVQIFEEIVVVVAAIKKYERVKRKSKFSFDSSNVENITTQKNFLLQHSIIRQLNEVLNVQNVNINQIVECMNIMKTIFIKFTTINLRIKNQVKLEWAFWSSLYKKTNKLARIRTLRRLSIISKWSF